MYGYSFELITGPMSCGKTEELLRRIKRCIIAKKKVIVFSPDVDTRSGGDYIESRNGLWLDAVKIKHSIQILSLVKDAQVVAIDELQFFDANIIPVITQLMNEGKKVIGTGLELDFKAEPFGYMPQLMCIATKVDKLHAVCMKCGCEHATRTQRLIDGKPAAAVKTLNGATLEAEAPGAERTRITLYVNGTGLAVCDCVVGKPLKSAYNEDTKTYTGEC